MSSLLSLLLSGTSLTRSRTAVVIHALHRYEMNFQGERISSSKQYERRLAPRIPHQPRSSSFSEKEQRSPSSMAHHEPRTSSFCAREERIPSPTTSQSSDDNERDWRGDGKTEDLMSLLPYASRLSADDDVDAEAKASEDVQDVDSCDADLDESEYNDCEDNSEFETWNEDDDIICNPTLFDNICRKLNWLCRYGYIQYGLKKKHNHFRLADMLCAVTTQEQWSPSQVMKVINEAMRPTSGNLWLRRWQRRFQVVRDKDRGEEYLRYRELPRKHHLKLLQRSFSHDKRKGKKRRVITKGSNLKRNSKQTKLHFVVSKTSRGSAGLAGAFFSTPIGAVCRRAVAHPSPIIAVHRATQPILIGAEIPIVSVSRPPSPLQPAPPPLSTLQPRRCQHPANSYRSLSVSTAAINPASASAAPDAANVPAGAVSTSAMRAAYDIVVADAAAPGLQIQDHRPCSQASNPSLVLQLPKLNPGMDHKNTRPQPSQRKRSQSRSPLENPGVWLERQRRRSSTKLIIIDNDDNNNDDDQAIDDDDDDPAPPPPRPQPKQAPRPRQPQPQDDHFDDEARNVWARLNLDPTRVQQGTHRAFDALLRNDSGGIFYVGNQTAAERLHLLQQHGITHVVNCTGNMELHHEGVRGNPITYFRFVIGSHWRYIYIYISIYIYIYIYSKQNKKHTRRAKTDHEAVEFVQPMLNFVGSALKQGKRVLAHCVAGRHRGGTTGIICLMYFAKLSRRDAIFTAQRLRPIIDPDNLHSLLMKLERGWKMAEKQS